MKYILTNQCGTSRQFSFNAVLVTPILRRLLTKMTRSEMLKPDDDSGDRDSSSSWESWDEYEVVSKLREDKLSDKIVDAFENAGIKGRCLKNLKFCNFMSEMGLGFSDCLELKKFLVKVGCWSAPVVGNFKIFNDPIHGNLQFHPVILAVIDTPQFQRLRYVKQLGLCYFVYPGAAHNRFEHSLGVCYLAGQFLRTLKDNQPELGIDDSDVLCLELAGLCHDLGHGPFSHVFDNRFIAEVRNSGWKHENGSRDMFQHLVDTHGLMRKDGIFIKYGLEQKDMEFVKELMAGPNKRAEAEWPYDGRDKSKAYLYEIIANKRNCIDVDKWDYIARDCHQLGFRNNFDHFRFIKFARVIEVDGEMQICIRDKESLNLYNMFINRYLLHKNAYQHKVNCALDIMVEQALIKADEHVKITGKDGKKFTISGCIEDMVAYTQLTDNILFKILDTGLPESSTEKSKRELESAKKIIQRIFNRDLFKCIKESQPLKPSDLNGMDDKKIKEKILENCTVDAGITDDDFFVKIVDLDYGMKEENPIHKLSIYSKSKPDEARLLSKEEISSILSPYTCKEQLVRFYVCDRRAETKSSAIKNAWDKWFTDHQNKMKEKDATSEAPSSEGEQQSTQSKVL